MTDTNAHIQAPRLRSWAAHVLSGGALAACVLASSPAGAQSDSARAGARVAAEAGDAAFKAGRYQEAADYFERAESMMHAPTLLLYAARSHLKLGHYVKAREAYIRVVREQLTASSPPAFLAAQEAAKAELPDAEKKIGRATIKVDGPPRNLLQITVDGAAAPAEVIGLPYPVDPGRHTIQISAEGWQPATAEFSVEEQKTSEVVLRLQRDPNAVVPPGGPGPGPGGSPGGDVPPGGDTGAPRGVNQGMRVGSYVAFGVGAVGVGLGTLFIMQKASKDDDADTKFNDNRCGTTPLDTSVCTPAVQREINDLGEDAASKATLSLVSFAAGGAALVTGVTLFVLSGSSGPSTSQAHVTPYFTGTGGGLLGRF